MSIKTWSNEQCDDEFRYPSEKYMLREIDELRSETKRLTGVAFLASAERDELLMELGDLPKAQADMLVTIKEQRKVLEQAMEAFKLVRFDSLNTSFKDWNIIKEANAAIQEALK